MRLFSARRRSIFTLLAMAGVLTALGVLFFGTRTPETRVLSAIAPGVSLLSVSTQTLNGPLRFWLVKAEKKAVEMSFEVADNRYITRKKSVRDIAARSKALVAINGGFFAYEGAAVGAVKVGGEWQRLPWKTRTALMWNEKEARIGAVSGVCSVVIEGWRGFSQSVTTIDAAALNGWLLPGTHSAIKDGFAVLTPRFALKYALPAGEIGLVVKENRVAGRVEGGEITIPDEGFLLIARGTSRALFEKPDAEFSASRIGNKVDLKVTTTPADADNFTHILGAGPLLIQNGIVKTTETEEEFRPDVIARGPRTAVGFDEGGNTLFLVADGRQAASVGLTLPETARLFQQLGAVQALNLDGGSSTQLVVKGQLINAPSGYDPARPLRPHEVLVSNALVLR